MVREIFISLWQIMEQAGYSCLDDQHWEELIAKFSSLYGNYKDMESPAKNLCRGAVFSLQKFYQRKSSSNTPAAIDDRTAIYNLFQDIVSICEANGPMNAGALKAKYSVCSPEVRELADEMVQAVKACQMEENNGKR